MVLPYEEGDIREEDILKDEISTSTQLSTYRQSPYKNGNFTIIYSLICTN